MYRGVFAISCLFALFVLTGCGGNDTNGGASGTDQQPTRNTGETDDETPCGGDTTDQEVEPEEDPDKWLKVVAPEPEGWRKLGKDGRNEILSPDYALLKKPPVEFRHITGFCSEEPPHPSSGTDEEWTEWRENASMVLIYAVSKGKDDVVEALKEHGGAFIEGFDDSGIIDRSGLATYVHEGGEKWLACVNNANGTYIFAALIRSEEDGELMKPYPNQLKPE